MNTLPSEEEIISTLRTKTPKELRDFQAKLLRINTPRAWEIRFYLMRELLYGYVTDPEDEERLYP